jgi:hypothetical protein
MAQGDYAIAFSTSQNGSLSNDAVSAFRPSSGDGGGYCDSLFRAETTTGNGRTEAARGIHCRAVEAQHDQVMEKERPYGAGYSAGSRPPGRLFVPAIKKPPQRRLQPILAVHQAKRMLHRSPAVS